MAKSKSFFGLRRGSTKTQTYSVLRGTQITKDRVYEVTNPKSDRQMLQRALFANAVKFYKHSVQAFFKFAYEDKRQQESEYNAFMRHNVAASLIFRKNMVDSKTFPAIGSEWMLTQGSLPNLDCRFLKETVDGTPTEWPVVVLPSATGAITTMGGLSSALVASYDLTAGDIITLVFVRSRAEDINDEEPASAPAWDIKQFLIDETDEALITTVLGVNAAVVSHEDVGYVLEFGYEPDPMYANGCAAVVSRNTPNGTKVSDSYLRNNSIAASIAADSKVQSYIDGALNSWGAGGAAILQGALVSAGGGVEPVPSVISCDYNTLGGTTQRGSVKTNIATLFGDDVNNLSGAVVAYKSGGSSSLSYGVCQPSDPEDPEDKSVSIVGPNLLIQLTEMEDGGVTYPAGTIARPLYAPGSIVYELVSLTLNGVVYNFVPENA